MTENQNIRIEKDTMGIIEVPYDKYWGAQTQRSLVSLFLFLFFGNILKYLKISILNFNIFLIKIGKF